MKQPRRVRRSFTAEQKYDILQKIEADIKSGMATAAAVEKADIGSSIYNKWKRRRSQGAFYEHTEIFVWNCLERKRDSNLL